MEKLARKVLGYLKNNHTKIVEREDFNGNYYSFVNDTIYLSKNLNSKKQTKNVTKINLKCANFVTICHECRHSVQNKFMHILNIVISNLDYLLFALSVIFRLLPKRVIIVNVAAILVIISSVVIRCILEIDATNNSTKIAEDLIKNNFLDEFKLEEIKEAKQYIKKHKILAITDMVKDKIILLIIQIIITMF